MALPDRPLTRVETFLDAIANGDASGLPSPLTREEQFLEAVANNDASGLPSPLTREEQYLGAIASGDASGIPNVPFTREEQYFEAIATGSDSYPSAPLTRTEQYLEYIAENGGGGGGSGTLETSGWVKELNGGATVSGNTIDLPKNSLTVSALIAPPDSAFESGDVLEIAVTVNSRTSYLRIDVGGSAATFSGPKDIWKIRSSNCHVQANTNGGPEVLTWTFTGDSAQLTIRACNGSGSQYQNTGNLDITGIKFNGTVIYGTV